MLATIPTLFRSYKDAQFLSGTFFKYKGEWVYCSRAKSWVSHASEAWLMRIYPLDKLKDALQDGFTQVDFSHILESEVEFIKPELGYANYSFGAAYIKQQLQPPNTGGWVGVPFNSLIFGAFGSIHYTQMGSFVQPTAFKDMLTNTYPTFASAWADIGGAATPSKWHSIAFCKDMCLARVSVNTVSLIYKDKPVGEFVPGDLPTTVKLYPLYAYLERKVKESTGLQNATSYAS